MNKQKTGVVLLARTGSSRLPRKVLLEICGKTVLEHVINRLQNITRASHIVVATSQNTRDNDIEILCKKIGISVFRGDEENVLRRCIGAIQTFNLNTIVRIGADSPLLDWEVIDDMLKTFEDLCNKNEHIEYLSNTLDRCFPIGLDAEIFKKETFFRIEKEIQSLPAEERQLNEINVVPYLHQNKHRFKTYSYTKKFDYSNLRWTLDTKNDFQLINKIYEALYSVNPEFLMRDILVLLEKNPDWSLINSNIIPQSGYWTDTENRKLQARLRMLNLNSHPSHTINQKTN